MTALLSSNYVGTEKRMDQLNYYTKVSYFNSTPDSKNTNEGTVRHDLPVKTGVSLLIQGPKRFSFESSLNYDYHRSRISNPGTCELDYRMHYAGLSAKGIFTLAEGKRFHWYAAAGAEGEWMVAGRLYTWINDHVNTIDPLNNHPFILSLTAATGVEFKFSELFGLYAEPGVALHSKPKGNLPDYYRDHPFSFDLHVGVRFNL